MKIIRNALYRMLGLETYLRLISRTFLCLVRMGCFKNKYPELFYLKKIVSEGCVCIDIGANLGYYSRSLSALCGNTGKLIAIEPVPVFGKIWAKNMKSSPFRNFKLEACALGAQNTKVKMGTPEVNGVLHHGMTQVMNESQTGFSLFFEVDMKIPDELFSSIERLDFVKVDVEGYEFEVFSNMLKTLSKYNPIIQTELSGAENRKNVISLLQSLNYAPYILKSGDLHPASNQDIEFGNQDFYFIMNH